MIMRTSLILLPLLLAFCHQDVQAGDLSLYSYLVGDGVTSGLEANGDEFRVNGKELKILSGSLHYFRVHPQYWRTRLRQYKAAGLNTVDVYVPWNLHEPRPNEFDFGSGTSQFSPFLNLTAFVEMIAEEDMLAIFRPGPYICGEWEFGGLPSWLLHQHPMFFRSSYERYEERAQIILQQVVAQVRHLQFYTESGSRGGPIIMTQIENEFGNYGYGDHPRDKAHLSFLKSVLRDEGIESLLFTSDTPTLTADWGNIDYELMTANFKFGSEAELKRIKELRPNSPILVSEFWPGWFDHWFEENHNTLSEADFREILGNIFAANGSVNFYMFHGGTNFGYMNGANILGFNGVETAPGYVPDVTSYDYDAPLTEAGQYTPKYLAAKEMIAEYDPLYSLLAHPEMPEIQSPKALPDIQFTEYLSFSDIVDQASSDMRETLTKPTWMEALSVNNGNGQSYGYLVYRKEVTLQAGSVLKIRGHPRDLVQVMVNGVNVNPPLLTTSALQTTFGSWAVRDAEFTFVDEIEGCEEFCTLDLMVENLGRANFGSPHNFEQKKGLWEGDVLLDERVLDDWEHISIEPTGAWLDQLQGWREYNRPDQDHYGPRILKAEFDLSDEATADTFFDYDCNSCTDWKHGAVFVNGFNVGRYHQAGPQKSLYIPGVLFKTGQNTIHVFENYLGDQVMKFTDTPNYGVPTIESSRKIRTGLSNDLP